MAKRRRVTGRPVRRIGKVWGALQQLEPRLALDGDSTWPTVNAGGDAQLTEGGTFVSLAYIQDSDTEANGLTATVDFGDGEGPQPVEINSDKTITLGHVYYEEPDAPLTGYTVTVNVSDGTHPAGSDTAFVGVVNSPPSLITPGTFAAGIRIGDSGGVFGIIGDYGQQDTHTVDVSWGDGTTSEASVDQIHRTFGDFHPYNSGFDRNAPSDSLAIWKLDETTGADVFDSARNNHGANFGVTTGVPGVFGTAYSFDGSHALAVTNNHLNVYSNDFAVSAWVQFTTVTPYMTVFVVYSGNNYYVLEINPDGSPYFGVRDAEVEAVSVNGDRALNDGDWHFLEGRRQGSVFSLFVDGVLQDQVDAPYIGSATSGGALYGRIGGARYDPSHPTNPTSSQSFFTGLIDEISVYSPSLANPWRSGFPVGITVTDDDGGFSTAAVGVTIAPNTAPSLDPIGNQSVAEGTLVSFTAVGTDLDLADNLTYSLAGAPAGATIDASTGVFNWIPTEAQGPGDHTFDVVVSDGDLSDTEIITISVNDDAWYPLDDNILDNTVPDVSGNNNHGTLPASSYAPVTTLDRRLDAGRAYLFDGVDDFLTLGPDLPDPAIPISTGFTVMAWGKAHELYDYGENRVRPIVSQRKFEGRPFVPQFLLTFDGRFNQNVAEFFLGSSLPGEEPGDGRVYVASGVDSICLDRWYHVAGIYDGVTQEMKLYLDGLLVASAPHAYMPTTLSTYDVMVGRNENEDRFNGAIDDVRIFGRALTSDDVYAIASENGPVGIITDVNAVENVVAENAAPGLPVGITAYASNFATCDVISYSLDDDAGGRFVIDATSGVVSVAATLDYEQAISHVITVRAASLDGTSSTTDFEIAVLDVEEDFVIPGTPDAEIFRFTATDVPGLFKYKHGVDPEVDITVAGDVIVVGGGGTDKIIINGTNLANVFEIHADRLSLNGFNFFDVEVEAREINALGSGDTITAFDGIATVNGGSATDTLVAGVAGPNEWLITAQNSGVLNGEITFTSIERLIGGANADAFRLADGVGVSSGVQGGGGNDTLDYSDYLTPVSVNLQSGSATKTGGISDIEYIIGGQATDTLTGPNSVNDWTQVVYDMGDINAVYYYEAFESLVGGNQADTFYLLGDMSGNLNGGGGADTLYFGRGDSITVNLQTDTASFIGGTFTSIAQILFGWGDEDSLIGPNANSNWALSGSNAGSVAGVGFQNLEYLVGGSATDTLTGPGQVSAWNLTGPDAGVTQEMAWTGMENLTGGNQSDFFFVGTGSSVSGTLSGGGGTDTLSYTSYGSGISIDMNGPSGTAVAHFTSIASVRGSSHVDTFTGANNNNAWAFPDTGGSVDGMLFEEFETWQGGSATDTLNGYDTTTIWDILGVGSGSIYGFAFAGMENLIGGNQFDTFVVHGGGVSGTINGGAGADILDYSPSANPVIVNLETMSATGVASFSSIAQVIGSAGSDTLLGADNANTWTITGIADGTVDSVGFGGFESLVGGSATDAFKVATGVSFAGTIDGGNGTDKLDYAGHLLAVQVHLGAGTATGVVGVIGIENVTGGDGNDTLVGSAANNNLSGGAGNDVVVGGAGDDTLSGNNGRDVVIGGTGVDLVHGNATEDILVGGFAVYSDEITHAVDQPALDSIIAEWSRTDLTYASRVAHLVGSTSGGLNGGNLLNGTTVTADGAVDILFGDAGLDWFLADDEDDVNNTGTEIVTGT